MTDADLPPPPVPADADLKDYPFTPIYRARLFGSSFHARATDAEWRAGVTLWLKSQDQVPAGSLPDDDIDLCRLAELGRDLKSWRKIKAGAMHGWKKHSDGRLYHPVTAEVVNEQLVGKLRRRWATECARARKQAQRRGIKIELPDFEEWMSSGQIISVPWDNDAASQEPSPPCREDASDMSQECPVENASNRKGEGKGEGSIGSVSSLRSEPAALPMDLKRQLWASGKALLAAYGVSIDRAGALLGKWSKTHSHGELIDILSKAEAAAPAGDIVSYIEGILARGRRGSGSNSAAHSPAAAEHSAEDQTLIWRTVLSSWVARGKNPSDWPETKGPPPGRLGCQVPIVLLDEFSLAEPEPQAVAG